MKYNIIRLNDDRKAYFDVLRQILGDGEIDIPAVNATEVNLHEELENRGIEHHGHIWGNPKAGELGVWLSNYDCWFTAAGMDEPLIVFEDDAIVDTFFWEKLYDVYKELPDDWDFVALWVPENQHLDFRYETVYENGIPRINRTRGDWETSQYDIGGRYAALVYQGYGMVSLMYSPKGAQKLIQLTKEYGITGPVDCWIYEQAHMGNLNGYAPRPEQASIVYYDWKAESHVQLTERIQ
jgi:GR25 family glycosyltransferase involved in LPS biosynthesis